ncbi:type II secretion system protein GspG [bacterium]|nr:type II secretion system protein GspG [bacterium]
MRPLCVAVVVVAAAGLARGQDDVEKAKAEKAERSVKSLLAACEAYYVNPQSGNTYPRTFGDLLKPPFGNASFLRDPTDIIDPWGKQYKYQIAPQADGTPAPYIWSEREVGGKTRVYGKKPPEPKKK